MPFPVQWHLRTLNRQVSFPAPPSCLVCCWWLLYITWHVQKMTRMCYSQAPFETVVQIQGADNVWTPGVDGSTIQELLCPPQLSQGQGCFHCAHRPQKLVKWKFGVFTCESCSLRGCRTQQVVSSGAVLGLDLGLVLNRLCGRARR